MLQFLKIKQIFTVFCCRANKNNQRTNKTEHRININYKNYRLPIGITDRHTYTHPQYETEVHTSLTAHYDYTTPQKID